MNYKIEYGFKLIIMLVLGFVLVYSVFKFPVYANTGNVILMFMWATFCSVILYIMMKLQENINRARSKHRWEKTFGVHNG